MPSSNEPFLVDDSEPEANDASEGPGAEDGLGIWDSCLADESDEGKDILSSHFSTIYSLYEKNHPSSPCLGPSPTRPRRRVGLKIFSSPSPLRPDPNNTIFEWRETERKLRQG